jgi:CheY-like chemotaxis protein
VGYRKAHTTDNFDTRRYIRSIFEPFCKVAEARDGREALDKFAKVNPDVIIADAKLPRVDGFELLQALRSGTRQQRLVPFVLLEPFKESHGKYGANADGE